MSLLGWGESLIAVLLQQRSMKKETVVHSPEPLPEIPVPMRHTLPDRVRLGAFEVDLRAGELRNHEGSIWLQEQPLSVLRMLVECAGDLVTREEIKQKLWPNDTVVDFDNGINATIRRLRHALGDSADEPKYIATIARRGYRLLPVAEPIIAPADDASSGGDRGTLVIGRGGGDLRTRTETASLIGKKVSHYRVLDVIGGGGMGLVYEAEDLKLGRRVALKFLPEELACHPAARQRFEREARAASSLDHSNICTIYEVEEHEQRSFIVMQLLQGETLRDRLAIADAGLPLDELLKIAIQICHGLLAAHEKRIAHRDVKPANIFLTTSGQVKLLDFGVAKLIEAEELPEIGQEWAALAASGASPSVTSTHLTRTGTAMGTAGYMSPEQVRGEKLDARSDIFSFGLVLYEMATGQRAFVGETALVVREAVLNQTPIAARERNSTLSPKLEEIINRAIEKDRERRYQSAAEVAADLERLAAPYGDSTGSKSRRHTRWVWPMAAAMICLAIITAGMYWRSHRAPKLTEQDTIVIADFENKTGDAVFDDTLKQGLSIQLQQSPFLNVLSDSEIAGTLQEMARPATTKLTADVARELCLRVGSKAYIVGSIAHLGNEYVLGLKAVNCETGAVLAQAQFTADAKEKVLEALTRASSRLRGQLGESLATAEKFEAPLYQATTPSLEALKEYSLGRKTDSENGLAASLPYHQRAVELDPNFAASYLEIAWIYVTLREPGRAIEYFSKAFKLRDHAGERERLAITGTYYANATGELDKAAQIDLEWIRKYPRDPDGYNSLSIVLATQGQYEEAAESDRKAIAISPDRAYLHSDLVIDYLALQRFDEAAAIIRDAKQRKLGENLFHNSLYALSFLHGDSAAMAEQQRWFEGHPEYADMGFALASDTAAYVGKVHTARAMSTRAVDSAVKADTKESGAILQANSALQEAAYGNSAVARNKAIKALKLAPTSEGAESEAALTFAMTNDISRAESLAQDLDRRFPLDTQMQSLWLPAIRAQLALDKKNAAAAVENLLVAVPPIELGYVPFVNNISCMYPTYVRSEAYLAASQGVAAAAEFQKIIDHTGIVWNCWTGALARLGLARAYALEAATQPSAREKARTAYQNFLTLWKDADRDIPIYKQAKAEYAKLQ